MNSLRHAGGTTQAYAWDGVLLFAPSSIATRRHAHFAATVLIAVDAPFALTLDGVGRRHYEIAILAPNVNRATDSEGRRVVDLLIDPDDDAYRYLSALLSRVPVVSLPGRRLARVRPRFDALFSGKLDCRAARRLVQDILAALEPRPPAALPWEPRIQRGMREMRRRIPHALPVIADIAAGVGLSESRFTHLFRAQMGLPVRRYLLWLRIRHAMGLWAQGQRLVDIAHGAGFYDQAHFARTVRRMTDYTPSALTDAAVCRHWCN